MIITGSEIRVQIRKKRIEISPFKSEFVNPNSYDLTLGNTIKYYKSMEYSTIGTAVEEANGYKSRVFYLDPAKENAMVEKTIPPEGVILLPDILYLASVNEEIYSNYFIAELSGKSSLARLGLVVHHTAGYANIGDRFKYILEIRATHPIRIYPNMRIAQVYFHTKLGDVISYHGKYHNLQCSDNVIGSLSYKEYTDKEISNNVPLITDISENKN